MHLVLDCRDGAARRRCGRHRWGRQDLRRWGREGHRGHGHRGSGRSSRGRRGSGRRGRPGSCRRHGRNDCRNPGIGCRLHRSRDRCLRLKNRQPPVKVRHFPRGQKTKLLNLSRQNCLLDLIVAHQNAKLREKLIEAGLLGRRRRTRRRGIECRVNASHDGGRIARVDAWRSGNRQRQGRALTGSLRRDGWACLRGDSGCNPGRGNMRYGRYCDCQGAAHGAMARFWRHNGRRRVKAGRRGRCGRVLHRDCAAGQWRLRFWNGRDGRWGGGMQA